MTEEMIKSAYFEWMLGKVCDEKNRHTRLLQLLNDISFVPTLAPDENRAGNGIDLRYRFGHEYRISNNEIGSLLDIRPCSVLEMMVALAIICEERIMLDPEIGDRTGQWFWGMIVSLGLGYLTDDRFDEKKARDIIDIFMYRMYKPNGEGGLFTIKNPKQDLRRVEIWTQANWYLGEVLKGA